VAGVSQQEAVVVINGHSISRRPGERVVCVDFDGSDLERGFGQFVCSGHEGFLEIDLKSAVNMAQGAIADFFGAESAQGERDQEFVFLAVNAT